MISNSVAGRVDAFVAEFVMSSFKSAKSVGGK